jgi:hypothetical protein
MQPGSPRPFGYEPYAPPGPQRGRPAVITWFRIYSATMAAFYVGFLALWQFLTPTGPRYEARAGTELGILLGLGFVVLVFGGFHVVAAAAPYKPWGWTIALVAICLGLTSCMFVAIPLLIYWLKPETKAAFGRL